MKKSNKVTFSWAFKKYIWPRRSMLGLGLLLILFQSVATLIAPYSTRYLLDYIVPNKDMGALWILLFVVAGAILLRSVISFLLTRLLSVQAQYMIAQMRGEVQRKLLRLPIGFFDDNKSGGLVSRVMSDVEGVRNLVGTGFVQLIGGSITSIGAIVLLLRDNPMMTICVLIPMILFAVVILKAFGFVRPIFRDRGKINQEVKGRLTESLNGVRVIKAFTAEEQENEVFAKGVDRIFQNVKKSLTVTALIMSASVFLVGVATTVIMGVGGHFMIEGTMEPGVFMSYIMLIGFMIAPIVQMGNIGSQLTEAMAGLDRTQELMNMPEEDDSELRSKELGAIKGDIEFHDVSFSYEESKEVIHSINFKAPAGSVTALVGSSGSGKSTIASLAATFIQPDSGEVKVDGVDLARVKLRSYRRNLGVVLQDDFLFEGTIRENILFPRPEATEDQLMEAVKGAYVNEFTDRFEDGLDTVIGERGVKLSGGQRQRISIARALLANPKIIILDEATSNLDTESESFIQKSLDILMKDRTTFVIAHRLSTIRQADQILVVEEGKIVERGTHDELLERKARYHELYTIQGRI
ncbi:MAG: ABC transporter ATP-binding protein [Bacteroidetes bacterium]|nr:MAG: ABC transporter ATP-binding protein [Bacteroidota bacterium]